MTRGEVIHFGREQLPLLCIDDFSPDPQALVNLATHADFIDVGSRYPGVRAPAPPGYAEVLLAELGWKIEDVFGTAPEPELDLCAFSMVTTPPAALAPQQRIPHVDGPEPRRIAVLHYLCGAEQGGTSFYRHRATGLEAVTADRLGEFRAQVARELGEAGLPSGYATGDSSCFEKIHGVAAAFNRLIVYRGNCLHSGDIGPGTVLCEDPRRGRLTINGFGFLRS
jgi:hypothetical protein